jgi:hypothetical protein
MTTRMPHNNTFARQIGVDKGKRRVYLDPTLVG